MGGGVNGDIWLITTVVYDHWRHITLGSEN